MFAETTGPLVPYYTERGILVAVDADQPPNSVTAGIQARLSGLGRYRDIPVPAYLWAMVRTQWPCVKPCRKPGEPAMLSEPGLRAGVADLIDWSVYPTRMTICGSRANRDHHRNGQWRGSAVRHGLRRGSA